VHHGTSQQQLAVVYLHFKEKLTFANFKEWYQTVQQYKSYLTYKEDIRRIKKVQHLQYLERYSLGIIAVTSLVEYCEKVLVRSPMFTDCI